MERVAFMIERTGERISCLLNPESLVLRRTAGVRRRQTAGGLVSGAQLADDPLFFTGGGTTELTLDLLFDVQLVAGSTLAATDVRQLTGPLWQLAENARAGPEAGRPPLARFCWGKQINVCGIVSSVAERLEHFTVDGTPQRSWLRMRMLRVAESEVDLDGGAIPPPPLPEELPEEPPELPNGPTLVHAVASEGAGGTEASSSERLDLLAYRYYGDPAAWRVLAWLNDIADPLRLEAGRLLRVAASWDLAGETEP